MSKDKLPVPTISSTVTEKNPRNVSYRHSLQPQSSANPEQGAFRHTRSHNWGKTNREVILKAPPLPITVITEASDDDEFGEVKLSSEENDRISFTQKQRKASDAQIKKKNETENLSINGDIKHKGRHSGRLYKKGDVENGYISGTSSAKSSINGSINGDINKQKIRHSQMHHQNGDVENGYLNGGYNANNIARSSVHGSVKSLPVIREQYCCCQRWSRLEKNLLIAVSCLGLVIIGLVIAVGILSDGRDARSASWFSWDP